MEFHYSWPICFTALVIFACVVGKVRGLGWSGILIDNRGRCSLTHFQVVVWTLFILSSFLGVLISEGFNPANISISAELLGLMGISFGSGVLTTGAKAIKDVPGSGADVGFDGKKIKQSARNKEEREIKARFSQIWLEEEGELADKVISITKFQNFIITLIVVWFYIILAWKHATLPTLPESVIWLIGISHAGYVGGKVPNKY